MASKPAIQSKDGPNGLWVGGIVGQQTLLMPSQLVNKGCGSLSLGFMPGQTTFRHGHGLPTTGQPRLIGCHFALRPRQFAVRGWLPPGLLIFGGQLDHFITPIMQLLGRCLRFVSGNLQLSDTALYPFTSDLGRCFSLC